MLRPAPLLTLRALNRATLERQMLLERRRLSPLQALERLVGLQAQAPDAPYVGLWSRIAGFRREQLTTAIVRRRIVRTALMRSTLHLVSADDALTLRPLLQAALQRALKSSRGRQLEGLDFATLARTAEALLDERPHTGAELAQALGEHWPDRDAASLAMAARNLLPLIHVPPAGTWRSHASPALTTARQWLARASALAVAATQEDLLLRYLAAFGPATSADATAWSGLGNWKAVIERLRPRLAVFRDEPIPMRRRRRASWPSGTTCCWRTPTARACCPRRIARRFSRSTASCAARCWSTGSSPAPGASSERRAA
jgi:hypothetical protein